MAGFVQTVASCSESDGGERVKDGMGDGVAIFAVDFGVVLGRHRLSVYG